MRSLLTRMEDRIHAHFPCSHKASNHFQIPKPDIVLEDDIIGEADSPIRLARCNGGLLHRRTMLADMSWWLAVDRRVGGGGGGSAFVSRGISRWSVVGWRVLCWAVVACGIGAGGILLWSVIGRGVVCWRVCALPCVLRHKVLAAVLHYCALASSAAPSLGGGAGQMQEKNEPKQSNPQYRQDPQCEKGLLSSVAFEDSSRNTSRSLINSLSSSGMLFQTSNANKILDCAPQMLSFPNQSLCICHLMFSVLRSILVLVPCAFSLWVVLWLYRLR